MINNVKVVFEYRENMEGVTIIQSVTSYDESGNKINDYQKFVGIEFSGDEAEKETIEYIAGELGVSIDIIDAYSEFIPTPWDD